MANITTGYYAVDGIALEVIDRSYLVSAGLPEETVSLCLDISSRAGGISCCILGDGGDAIIDQLCAVHGLSITDRKHLITIHKDLADSLDGGELVAIIDHEVGHVKIGHLEHNLNENVTGIHYDINQEIEADSYSVSKGNRAGVLISAINKCRNFRSERTSKPSLPSRVTDAIATWTRKTNIKITEKKLAKLTVQA